MKAMEPAQTATTSVLRPTLGKKIFNKLQTNLGYKFKMKKRDLEEVLFEPNTALESMGEDCLRAIISTLIMRQKRWSVSTSKELSKIRDMLTSNRILSDIAKHIGLSLLLVKVINSTDISEELVSKKILKIVAAITLENRNNEPLENVVRRLWHPYLKSEKFEFKSEPELAPESVQLLRPASQPSPYLQASVSATASATTAAVASSSSNANSQSVGAVSSKQLPSSSLIATISPIFTSPASSSTVASTTPVPSTAAAQNASAQPVNPLPEKKEEPIDLMTVPGVQELFTQHLSVAQQRAAPLLKSIDTRLAQEAPPEKCKETAHQILCEIQGYLYAYEADTDVCLVYCEAFDFIKNKYADKEFVDQIELPSTYTILPDKAKIFPKILSEHPSLLPKPEVNQAKALTL
jgi:dsRNA-specific ribonuclease